VRLGFEPVPVYQGDELLVARGYTARPFLPAGTPICPPYPPYLEGGRNSGADQESQVGHHHDGMHFFPLGEDEDASAHGLLCLNHEYIDVWKLHPNGPTVVDETRTVPDEVRKEVAAHGVSVVEIRRGPDREWEVVRGPYNRRITAETPMEIRGPVRGSDLVKTLHSQDGTRARGTLNNCAHGVTPWNTYLTCEENWAFYFANRGDNPREHARYGIRRTAGRYGWATIQDIDAYARFDASEKGASPIEDYRNEPNTMGWIVEIDPFDPESTPQKRTALGRFAHEGCVAGPAVDGRPLTLYMGDDAMDEYIYKFVTARLYEAATATGELLDEGTLYAARFDPDGTGEWIPLCTDTESFVDGFSVAEVLIHTRLAADRVGPTKMDRPEDFEPSPATGKVYCALTNNSAREPGQADEPNPRGPNKYGHILEIIEDGADSGATTFTWNVPLVCGNPEDEDTYYAGYDKSKVMPISAPDNVAFDKQGNLWIATDGQPGSLGTNDALHVMPVEGRFRGELKTFATVPVEAETCGPFITQDGKTVFLAPQHPGENGTFEAPTSVWPDGDFPRPSVACIWHKGGRAVGQ
jgi:uncharacterized protein